MRIYHDRIGLLSEDKTEIVRYAHERHKKGECDWCDFCRVRGIARDFKIRMDLCGQNISNLYMWSLGTSLRDSAFNRKLILKRWHDFTKRTWRRTDWTPVFRVLEVGRRGFLHFHVVTISYCPHSVIKTIWRSLTKEKSNVHVSSMRGDHDPGRLVNYLMKYLTKKGSSYRWLGPFFGLGRRRSRAVTTPERDVLLYGGICYGGYWTENRERDPDRQKTL